MFLFSMDAIQCQMSPVIWLQEETLFSLGEWVELANGCLCCSVKDDFLRALEALMEQRRTFDYILIETTGELPELLCQVIVHEYRCLD